METFQQIFKFKSLQCHDNESKYIRKGTTGKRIKQIQNLFCPRKQFDINSIYIFLNFILHISKSKWRKEII